MELHQHHLLLVRQRVEGAGFKAREGVVCGCEEGEFTVGATDLAINLVTHLSAPQQPNQYGELACLGKDFIDIWRSCRSRRQSRSLS